MRSREAPASTPARRAGVDVPERHDAGQGTLAFVVSLGLGGAFIASLVVAFVLVVRTDSNGGEHADPSWAASFSDWLALDASVAPPFQPEDDEQGGIELGHSDLLAPVNDRCDVGGTNLFHVRRQEPGLVVSEVVANYRYVVDGRSASVVRVSCERAGEAPFAGERTIQMAAGLDPATTPVVELDRDLVTGRVETVSIRLTTDIGDEVIVVADARQAIDIGRS